MVARDGTTVSRGSLDKTFLKVRDSTWEAWTVQISYDMDLAAFDMSFGGEHVSLTRVVAACGSVCEVDG